MSIKSEGFKTEKRLNFNRKGVLSGLKGGLFIKSEGLMRHFKSKMKDKTTKMEGRIGSKAGLARVLSGLKGFDEAKVRLEQYITDGETAADILWNMYILGDIDGKVIVDLGAGTGILGIGAGLLGAKKVILVDMDKNALNIVKENISKLKSEGYDSICDMEIVERDIESRVGKEGGEGKKVIKGDIVVENPPFGTKVRHADIMFLEKALEIASVVYSLHKSESKGFLERFADKRNAKMTHAWKYELPLKAAFGFHTRRIHRISVSCFRFSTTK